LWFFDDGKQIRKNSGWKPPFRLADTLWPEKSYNKLKLSNQNISVTEIKCPKLLDPCIARIPQMGKIH
jgi:hypothetical protein